MVKWNKRRAEKAQIAVAFFGGGVAGSEWWSTGEKTFVINGDMYEDAYTTSTY